MNESFWCADFAGQRYEKLGRNYVVDVVVIGAGITGATAAYLMKRLGRTVALLERETWGEGDSGQTTAHLTCVTDTRLTELVRTLGRDHAAAVWDAGVAAIEQIEENVRHGGMECGFRRVPGYLCASLRGEHGDERETLMEEAALARSLGFEATYTDRVGLREGADGLLQGAGMRVANQAMIHPRKYIGEMVRRIPGGGSHVFEGTEVVDVADAGRGVNGPRLLVKSHAGHVIECGYVVVATHVPLLGKAALVSGMMLQSKLAPYSTYVVGAWVPKGTVSRALFWDTSEPYYYLRIAQEGEREDYVIFGGEDHKTGQESETERRYARLGAVLLEILPGARLDRGWSGQVINTNDGLPLIGEMGEKQFVATGFAGNGMTFGTLGGMMAVDAMTMRVNPWKQLFDVNRTQAIGGAWDYVKQNLDYPFYMVKDRLMGAAGGVGSIGPGDGKVVMENGRRVAAYRDVEGKLVRLSPVCQHMGCIVHWNSAEGTWDCPCHGSRYKATGEVISGPAEEGLGKV